jgi:uncharacterized protein YndB with AHSA1/START domain
MMDGVLEAVGERWRLRFTRRLAHAPDTVWRAIVEDEHRDVWFPQRIVGEWRVGARLRFVSEHGEFEGEVRAFDPPRFVEFSWGTDVLRLEVDPDGDGTLLTLTDTFAELGKAARDAAGWHICLDALAGSLAGQPPTAPPRERWQAAHSAYVEHFGPEAATIGPPAAPARQ